MTSVLVGALIGLRSRIRVLDIWSLGSNGSNGSNGGTLILAIIPSFHHSIPNTPYGLGSGKWVRLSGEWRVILLLLTTPEQP